ncbi:hypothetical protein [Pseudarthrobacter sp. H2]|uniref:hypothetical protein n=1 Tax=Pseudarthrobacter sp. H2 TaxID=3418415 RepID=UPI003CE78DE3
MDDTADETPPLVAAPRHLRRRVFHEEIPDLLLVPGVPPFAIGPDGTGTAKRQAATANPRGTAVQRKRRVALLGVIIVSLVIPALLIALILAG